MDLAPSYGKQKYKQSNTLCCRISKFHVMIMTGRPLYIEELVIHVTAHVSGPKPGLCYALLCFVTCTAWPSGLSLAVHIYWLQDKLTWLTVAEEPTGSSHLVLVITPPVCPFLYWIVQQQVPMGTPFCWTVEMMNRIVFIVRQSYESSEEQNGINFLWMDLQSMPHPFGTAQFGIASTWSDVSLSILWCLS